MGVYIKGLEMLKNCCACPLFKSNMSKQLFCKAFGAFDKSVYDKLPIERMKDCPLVPVPPHGRLIDGDGLAEEQKENVRAYHANLITLNDLAECLLEQSISEDYAPTIIPAEGGEA